MPKQPVLYEAMYILDSALDADAAQGIVTTLEEFVSSNGGEVVATREFGRRRLAFEIEGHTNGTFMILYFRSHGDLVAELAHEMRLVEGIVRGIVVVANPKAIFEPKAPEAAAPAAEEAPAPEEAPAAEETAADQEAPEVVQAEIAGELAPTEEAAPEAEAEAEEAAEEPAAEAEAEPEAEAAPEAEAEAEAAPEAEPEAPEAAPAGEEA